MTTFVRTLTFLVTVQFKLERMSALLSVSRQKIIIMMFNLLIPTQYTPQQPEYVQRIPADIMMTLRFQKSETGTWNLEKDFKLATLVPGPS